MMLEDFYAQLREMAVGAQDALFRPEAITQLATVVLIYGMAWIIAGRIRHVVPFLDASEEIIRDSVVRKYISRLSNLVFPLLAILLLRISLEVSQTLLDGVDADCTAIAVLLLAASIIRNFVRSSTVLRYLGLPLLFLHMVRASPSRYHTRVN